MKKKRVSVGRIIRNAVAAVLIVSMLGVTAYAAVGYLIFDSPEEMVASIFGDKTGYDHKGVTHWTDPDKPGSVYDNPAYDRVPVDETVMAEDIVPHVSPVGQTITFEGNTLTVDAFMYDSRSGCGFVTYLLENPNGVGGYKLQNNGSIWYEGVPDVVQVNLYGYPYIIQEKTTDTCLAVTYYFMDTGMNRTDELELYFSGAERELSNDEIIEAQKALDEQVRQEYTPEEAVAAMKESMGQAWINEYVGEQPEWYDGEEDWTVYNAYTLLAGDLYHAQYDLAEEAIKIPLQGDPLVSVTAENGSVTVTPICVQVDVTDLEFLHEDINGERYIRGDNVDTVTIRYTDGSEYVVRGEDVDNTVYGVITSASDGERDTSNLLTYMFNRIIDVDKIASVIVNGVELTVD